MKVLLIGLGQLGLGLIVPVFRKAGYELVGTDADTVRLNTLSKGYFLRTPFKMREGYVSIGYRIETIQLDEVEDTFDFIVTSVGRKHLPKVAEWYQTKKLSAPVLLAENLPDPVNLFPRQIPIVVDRICPRIEQQGKYPPITVAEDYYKIVVLNDPLTRWLKALDGAELENLMEEVEKKRMMKMFTVNTCHVITALFGQGVNCRLIEEAVRHKEIRSRIHSVISEVAIWLDFSPTVAKAKAREIIARFSSPIQDPLLRILNKDNIHSARRYIDVPLKNLRLIGAPSPILEEAEKLLDI